MQKTTIYTASRWVKTCLRRSLQLKLSTYWAIPLSDSQTTDASVHDSNIIKPLIDEVKYKGQDLFLDAGYESKDGIVKNKGVNPIICVKGHRNNPLTEEQKKSNRVKSKDRCRIEHIFGFIEGGDERNACPHHLGIRLRHGMMRLVNHQ